MNLKLITMFALSISSINAFSTLLGRSNPTASTLAALTHEDVLRIRNFLEIFAQYQDRIDHAERLVEDHKRHLAAIDAEINALKEQLPSGFFIQPRIERLEGALEALTHKFETQEKITIDNQLSLSSIANAVIQIQANFDELKAIVDKLTAPHFVEQRPAGSVCVDSFDIDRERIMPFIRSSIEQALKSYGLIDRTHFLPIAQLAVQVDTDVRLLRAHVEQLQQVIQIQKTAAAAGAIQMRQLTAPRPNQSHRRTNSVS